MKSLLSLQIEDWHDQNYKKNVSWGTKLVRKKKQEVTEKRKTWTKKTEIGFKRKGMEITFLSSKTELYMFISMSIHISFPASFASKLFPHFTNFPIYLL